MDARTLIALFGQEMGVPMALSEAGTVSLAFEVGPTVHLEYDPMINGLQCYVVLGQAPAEQPACEALFCRMLVANVFGCDTDGATLGLDEVTGDLILSRCVDLAHADTASLRVILESMVPLALDWQRRLAGPFPDGDKDVGGGGTRRLYDPAFGLPA